MREGSSSILALCALALASGAGGQTCQSPLPAAVGDTAFATTPGTLLSLTAAGSSCDVSSFGSNIIFNVSWLRFVPPSTGDFQISTCGLVPFDSRIAVFGECGNQLACIAGNDDSSGCQLSSSSVQWASRITLPAATAGVPYFVAVGSSGSTVNGSGSVRIMPVGSQQDGLTCETAFSAATGANSFNNSPSTVGLTAPPGCSFGTGTDQVIHRAAWFRWTASATGTVEVSTCGSAPFDTRLAVIDGCGASAASVGCNDDAPGCAGFTGKVAFEATAGTEYRIVVGGRTAAGAGAGTFTVTEGIPPAPTCGTASQSCCAAGTLPFCSDGACCLLVCGEDPFCCSTDGEWDQVCADRAAVLCQSCGAGTCALDGTSAAEAEPCGTSANAGCDEEPPAVVPLQAGVPVSGTFWADADARDVDWYEFSVGGISTVSLALRSPGPGQLFLVDDQCPPAVLASTSEFSGACPASIEACVLPGTYRVLATMSVFDGFPCGSADGRNGYELSLQVAACSALPPANDECGAPAAVPANGAALEFDTRLASDSEGTLPASCEEGNGLNIVRDVWYLWTPAAGTARIRTCGGDETLVRGADPQLDTRLAVYSACGGALVACNDDSDECTGFGSSLLLPGDGNTSYLVRLGGFDSAGTGTIRFEVFEPVPNDECSSATDLDPSGATQFSTGVATDSAPALPSPDCNEGFGTAIRKDVWFRYVAPCTGTATASTCSTSAFDTWLAAYDGCGGALLACNDDSTGCELLTSTMAFPVQAGSAYLLRVGGHDASGSGTLTVTCNDPSLPPPANDDCGGATPIAAGGAPTAFDTTRATSGEPSAPGGGCAGTGIYKDVWFTFAPVRGGLCSLSLCGGATFDTRLEVWDACPDAGGAVVACNDDGCGPQSSMNAILLCSRTYLVRVAGFGPASAGPGALSVTDGPLDCASPCPEDLDGDSLVDGSDIGRLLLGWGSPGPSDINGDGLTNGADVALLLAAWGPCGSAP